MIQTTDKILLGVITFFLLVGSATFISAGGFETLFGQKDAERVALELIPGEIQEVDIEKENGQLIYEIDVKQGDKEQEVTISEHGHVIGVEEEEVDEPITGTALERASQAALDYIGEGRVTDSEIGDEEGYYEIEITLDNGDEVDVHLDSDFNVLSTEHD